MACKKKMFIDQHFFGSDNGKVRRKFLYFIKKATRKAINEVVKEIGTGIRPSLMFETLILALTKFILDSK